MLTSPGRMRGQRNCYQSGGWNRQAVFKFQPRESINLFLLLPTEVGVGAAGRQGSVFSLGWK